MTLDQLRRKARYGHNCFLHWREEDGTFGWAPYGRSGMKKAILATGSRRPLYWFDSSGNSNIARELHYKLYLWKCAINISR
jgi:hypothetical protein